MEGFLLAIYLVIRAVVDFKALLYSLQTHFRSFTVVGQYFEGANVNTSYSGLNKKGASVEEGASVAHEFQWPPIIPKTLDAPNKTGE